MFLTKTVLWNSYCVFRKRNDSISHHSPSCILDCQMRMPAQGNEDFFSALLDGYDSVSGSPVWSPSPSDSGTSEDPHSDHIESPPPTASPLLNPRIVVSQAQHNLDTNFPFNFSEYQVFVNLPCDSRLCKHRWLASYLLIHCIVPGFCYTFRR